MRDVYYLYNPFWPNGSASNRKERKKVKEKKTYLSFILRHIGALVESHLSCGKSDCLESTSVHRGNRKKRLWMLGEVFRRLGSKEEGHK